MSRNNILFGIQDEMPNSFHNTLILLGKKFVWISKFKDTVPRMTMALYMLGIQHTNTNCYVCRPVQKRHRHANTQYMYKRSAMLGVAPDCFMCLDPDHPQQTTGRIKLLSTSSTLHHVQLSATYNEEIIAAHLDFLASTFHVDIDTHRVKMFIKILKYFFYRTTFCSEVAMVTGEEGSLAVRRDFLTFILIPKLKSCILTY